MTIMSVGNKEWHLSSAVSTGWSPLPFIIVQDQIITSCVGCLEGRKCYAFHDLVMTWLRWPQHQGDTPVFKSTKSNGQPKGTEPNQNVKCPGRRAEREWWDRQAFYDQVFQTAFSATWTPGVITPHLKRRSQWDHHVNMLGHPVNQIKNG